MLLPPASHESSKVNPKVAVSRVPKTKNVRTPKALARKVREKRRVVFESEDETPFEGFADEDDESASEESDDQPRPATTSKSKRETVGKKEAKGKEKAVLTVASTKQTRNRLHKAQQLSQTEEETKRLNDDLNDQIAELREEASFFLSNCVFMLTKGAE